MLSRRAFLRANRNLDQSPTRPPWALPEDRFVSVCSRCDDCIRTCPENILQRGDGGFPWLDYSAGGCTFCADCLQACTTGALVDHGQPALAFIAEVTERCLNPQGVICRSCVDECETEAIQIRPRPGGRAEVSILAELCSGCGACMAPCPVKAISMQPLSVQSTETV